MGEGVKEALAARCRELAEEVLRERTKVEQVLPHCYVLFRLHCAFPHHRMRESRCIRLSEDGDVETGFIDAAVYDALRENTAAATALHSFRDPIYHDAAICYFEGQARQIVAHLTLDKPSPWTRFVADSLFKRVMRVSHIYRDVIVYHHAYEFTHDDNTLPMT